VQQCAVTVQIGANQCSSSDGESKYEICSQHQSLRALVLLYLMFFQPKPGWRNWQTQRTQNPPGFGPWGFDSPSRHQPPISTYFHACPQIVIG
jgi:hypothetical protein